jgi:hypothetical protein
MPAFMKSFDSYKIYHYGGPQPFEGYMEAVWIPCFSGGRQVGSLCFMIEPARIQENRIINDQITLFYDIGRFIEIVNTLRYEAPLFLMINTDTKEGALVTRDLERVGEEESAR